MSLSSASPVPSVSAPIEMVCAWGLQPFDPRVAGLGDPDLEAVDAGLERPVRRDPDDEGVDEAVAAGRGRLLGHSADGVLIDPEPDLLAVRIEPGPEPEGPPVRFPDGVVRRQGPGSAGPVLAAFPR